MKKLLLSMSFAALAFCLKAQEAVVGGNMEDATKWTVTQIVKEEGKEATVTFNFTGTDSLPTAGSGGAMRVFATNAAGGSGNNVII